MMKPLMTLVLGSALICGGTGMVSAQPLNLEARWQAPGPDDRQDRRQERGRSDERQDRRDCRQEEGRVGQDKRECKQDEVRDGVRGHRGDEKEESSEPPRD